MSKSSLKAFAAILCLVQAVPASVLAAPKNISTRVTAIAPSIEGIKVPAIGTLSDFSIGTLGTLPGLSAVKVPLFGTLQGLPEFGSLTLEQETGLLVSLSALQNPLAGFQVGSLSMLTQH